MRWSVRPGDGAEYDPTEYEPSEFEVQTMVNSPLLYGIGDSKGVRVLNLEWLPEGRIITIPMLVHLDDIEEADIGVVCRTADVGLIRAMHPSEVAWTAVTDSAQTSWSFGDVTNQVAVNLEITSVARQHKDIQLRVVYGLVGDLI